MVIENFHSASDIILRVTFILLALILVAACSDDPGGPTLASCNDTDEPNNTEMTATALTDVTDLDSERYLFSNTASGSSDTDYFQFAATDGMALADPYLEIVSSDANLDMCLYVSCNDGNATPTCPAGSTPSTSADGLSGCCQSSASVSDTINFTLSCSGINDDATIVLSIKPSNDNSCVNYQMRTGF